MYSNCSNRTQPATTIEKRPTDKPPSFIQRFYLFGTNPSTGSSSSSSSCSSSTPSSPTTPNPTPSLPEKSKKNPQDNSETELPCHSVHSHHYSVQRLKQFWNNRLSLSTAECAPNSEATISRKLKSVSLGPLRKPTTPEFLRRNSATRGSTSRRNVVRSSLVPLYSKTSSPKATRSREGDPDTSISSNQKRSSVVLSPVKDLKKEKRSCLERVGSNAGFPLVTATASGGRINWARRVELLGIRSQKEDLKMPIKAENFVNNYIEVDIQNEPPKLPTSPPPELTVEEQKSSMAVPSEKVEIAPPKQGMRDSLDSKKSLSSNDSLSAGRRHGTPTRKVSFRTTTSPYNRKLLHAKENKVMALTNKFNKMCQQDAGILEEVRKRGGYFHKSGSHVYKVLDGEGSLRKKPSTTGSGTRADESSDDVSVGSKGSYKRAGVKKRPSLRKNLYRKPDWELANRTSVCVKEALEIFEPNSHHNQSVTPMTDKKPPAGRAKPKVPDKSDQVIRKTKELKNKRAIQIDANNCDIPRKYNEIVVDKVPNSNSQDSISDVVGRSENDGNTQAVEEVAKSGDVIIEIVKRKEPERVVDEYSVVQKKSDILQDELVKQKKDKRSKESSKSIGEKDLSSLPPKQKSAVQRIYEKFTFRSTKKINLSSPERTSSESQLNSSFDSEDRLLFAQDNILTRKNFVSSIEIPTIHIEESQESSSDHSDRKIVDAIKSLNLKIDNLSRSFNDLTIKDSEPELVPKQEQEPAVQPNNSFLFRSMSKISTGTETAISHLDIVQAVNTVVINKSISMDHHHFPCRTNLDRLSLNEKIPVVMVSKAISASENDYEMVSRVESPRRSESSSVSFHGSSMSIDLMELTANIDSFVYKAKNAESSINQTSTPSVDTPTAEKTIHPDTVSLNSYESFENYESIDRTGSSPHREEDAYEICNPPEPLPPRNDAQSPNDLALPQPKRNLAGSPNFLSKNQPTYQSNYEKIKYDKTPPRPPKPEEVPLPPRNSVPMELSNSHRETTSASPTLSEEPIYEENIYDTIKNSDGLDYDDPNGSAEATVIKRPKQNLPADAVSIISSNCYESIGSKLLAMDYLRHSGATLPRMGSISTLASDQITNSLYGCNTNVGQSLTPPSERGSDTSNSAEWTDISDDEDEDETNGRSNFIIVRKRNKTHQTPVWSRKVRNKLVSQQQQEQQRLSKHDDDSDHVYESLESHSLSQIISSSIQNRRVPPPPPSTINGNTTTEVGTDDIGNPTSDPPFLDAIDSDSFDSDESDEERKHDSYTLHNPTSDINCAKQLPDPPTSNNQMYALMQKIRNIGTLSKSELAKGFNKFSKKKASSSKPPKIFTGENLTFPPGPDETTSYENTPLPKTPKSKSKSFKLPLQLGSASKPLSDDYENTDFHQAVTPTSISPNGSAPASSPAFEQADRSILASISNSDSSNVSTFRKKSKTGKSLRSKFRKSLQSESSLNIGSSFNGSRSTFYVTDSLDVDSGIFNGSEPNSSSSNLNVASVGKDNSSPQKTVIHKTPDADRRKSLNGVSPASRPTIPPPPPPTSAPGGDKKFLKNRKLGATSWYAECGVFKADSLKQAASFENELKNKERSTTSWYAEAGLYQTSDVSVASSSESSGVSTGGEGGGEDDHSHSMFVNEPLYQIYNAAKLESLSRDIDAEITGGDTELYDDGYEKISDNGKDALGTNRFADEDNVSRKLRPTAFELIEPNVGKLRTLWCEIPEVINSEILLSLSPNEKRLQEAKFEILTSEASYLKSLNLLKTHFINHPAFRDVKILTSSERKTLFANIIPVQECSDRLLCDLENCWQDNIMLLGLSHSIYKHAEKHFHVYVNYCEHQAKIDRTLKNLKANKAEFNKTLLELESDPICCGLSLSSFLMLPMQRITRMRLLLDAVLQRLKSDDDEFTNWENTFVLINRILTQCNDAAHRSEQMYEMEMISRQIEFPPHIRPLAIVPYGIGPPGSVMRKLEKKGPLVHLLWRGDDAKLTFGKKFSKSNIYAFLFTDLLVLTKKKGDETFLVTDYCPRALLTVNSGDIVPQLPTKEMAAIGKHLIIMTLLENYEGKTIEMVISCPTETDRERWLKVTEPLSSENPDEKIYEQWDCPQVVAIHPYHALQPDELDLDITDVVNVHRKMADGWYEGERIRDGSIGWFPSNYTKEIPSAHVRAKHIKQRHMLLSYTSKYIDTTTRTLQHSKK